MNSRLRGYQVDTVMTLAGAVETESTQLPYLRKKQQKGGWKTGMGEMGNPRPRKEGIGRAPKTPGFRGSKKVGCNCKAKKRTSGAKVITLLIGDKTSLK